MASRAQNRVTMACVLHPTPGYPFTLGLEVEYRLGREGLTVHSGAENLGVDPLPFGLGFHPYFTVGTPTIDTVRLTVPAERRLVTDERGLPTGDAPVQGTEFDFTEWSDHRNHRTGYRLLVTAAGRGRLRRVYVDHSDGDPGVTVWVDRAVRLPDGLYR